MNDESRAVLTEALVEASYDYWYEKQTLGVDSRGKDVCAYLVDRLLSLPGVAVIQLPEPEVWDGPGKERYWRIGDTTVTVDKWNVLSVTLNDDWSDDETPPSAADFRDLAAALLAAAAVVAEGEA
ncbi:hypothetical protein KHO61_gp006 [Mycobacterium phage Mangeria]|uniref:Uncharacterized protein n=1 Tax=Mycobacterium phage Mangeria TaxID=2686471 RepID=A0A6B9M128_9CAUD|nr:hypothetical protein KHO61_gp006 [Mycobacterium phage Mangeria]QHB47576.1 hypothetical protein SEA_MANGERIA_6 [Mycobacterium phage Mangeria]